MAKFGSWQGAKTRVTDPPPTTVVLNLNPIPFCVLRCFVLTWKRNNDIWTLGPDYNIYGSNILLHHIRHLMLPNKIYRVNYIRDISIISGIINRYFFFFLHLAFKLAKILDS